MLKIFLSYGLAGFFWSLRVTAPKRNFEHLGSQHSMIKVEPSVQVHPLLFFLAQRLQPCDSPAVVAADLA